MAIEKMTLVNMKGPLEKLDDVIIRCSDLGCFHPEDITPTGNVNTSFEELKYRNPYQSLLNKMVALAHNANIPLEFRDIEGEVSNHKDAAEFTKNFESQLNKLQKDQHELLENVEQHSNALVHLHHLAGMKLSFDKIFSSKYLKVRFGRLPRDSEPKLEFYGNKMFLYFPFDQDDAYIWCVYFTTNEYVDEADNIFSALFFERVRIPDYIHGQPQEAIAKLEAQYEEEKKRLSDAELRLSTLITTNREMFLDYYSHIKFLCTTFDLRRYVGVSGQTFYMTGFIPKSDEKRFAEQIESIPSVSLDLLPEDNDKRFAAPTKLKNNRLVQPFEMFVKMYGLPSHKDIDPTPYVAIVYTLLFGIMFGDLGQGLVVSLVGYLMYKWKGMELGRVMTRIGISSAVFGLVYGSVFGFEHALDPLYHAIGLSGKPIEVLEASTINVLLIAAIGIGAVIIMISILINILLGIKQRDWERAVFSQNGIAGLLFYGTILTGMILTMTGSSFFNPLTVCLGILLPLLVIFFKEPLSKLVHGLKYHPESGVGGFIAESFFELFEVVLSFIANTMSFLRVGGFVLSHAGMMAVVFTISSMMSTVGSPIVIVLGNIFVMCLEGLIVGIQVLRLQFYEMFSRFFSGEGEPFHPISVDMSAES